MINKEAKETRATKQYTVTRRRRGLAKRQYHELVCLVCHDGVEIGGRS